MFLFFLNNTWMHLNKELLFFPWGYQGSLEPYGRFFDSSCPFIMDAIWWIFWASRFNVWANHPIFYDIKPLDFLYPHCQPYQQSQLQFCFALSQTLPVCQISPLLEHHRFAIFCIRLPCFVWCSGPCGGWLRSIYLMWWEALLHSSAQWSHWPFLHHTS